MFNVTLILDLMWLPSPFWQVNIDHRTREKTKQSLEDPSPTSFNEIQAKIYSLMERDSYPRFLRSKMYQDMVNRAHAQGQRRSVWPNLVKENGGNRMGPVLHNVLTSSLNTVNLQRSSNMLDCFLCLHQHLACSPTKTEKKACLRGWG